MNEGAIRATWNIIVALSLAASRNIARPALPSLSTVGNNGIPPRREILGLNPQFCSFEIARCDTVESGEVKCRTR